MGQISDIPLRERHLLYALALMCEQYMGEELDGRTVLDHLCMSAGEEAYKVLQAYGLIDVAGRRATWTKLGTDLLEERLDQQPFSS